ncbi:MAG TPA: HAMP domain-containing sensor histidine kinase, partial [Sphingobacteriaceae bacterium]
DHKPETEILHKLAAVYKARGNLEAALNYKEQQLATADSFYYRKMSQKIENLQAAHELSISQAKVQELRLQNAHQQLEKVVIISVSVAVFLLLAILGFHYSRIRKFNARLNQANSDLTESNTVKDKLFSVLAHDLRSPMASIILLLEFINDDLLTEEEKKAMVNQLSVECKASLEMLNNLLKWGHMQIKGVHLNQEYISPAEIIGRTRTLLTSAAGKKDIRIKESMEADLRVFSDPDHFEFIIRNLLSNAIKFTSEGGRVEITGKRCPNTGVTEFSVRDNGIGISSDRLQKVFSIHNVSTHGTNDEKGSSLGLLMCKEFIEANRGTIRVISEPGKGSEFIFTLPEKAADKNKTVASISN